MRERTLPARSSDRSEEYHLASQWRLMGRKFRKHKLALAGSAVLALFYLTAMLAGFLAPYDAHHRFRDFINTAPQGPRFIDANGRFHARPFVYGLTSVLNRETFRREIVADTSQRYPVRLLARGDRYKFWGLFTTDVHLFGVDEPGVLLLFGTDALGRDLFSRNIHGARVSLSVGLVGVILSFVLGTILGGISGYFGRAADMVIQRIIEFLLSIPTIPLWMALAASLPREWSVIQVYFFITIILAIRGWCGLARVVRGKLLELREEDFVMAARISGTGDAAIIAKHLLPAFMSYLIVHLTLSIPFMILGETALSFLGLGLRPPAVSWGTLLQDAQNVSAVALFPWLLIPAVFVIISVLAFNALGDGLRDAADPYK